MLVTHSSLCDPMDCSLPVSSVHGISQAKILEWVVIPLLQGIFLTQELNLGLLHCRQILYCLSHQEGPFAFVQLHKWLFSENWRSFPGCGHAETLIARTHAKS